jgi:hypothetical protein
MLTVPNVVMAGGPPGDALLFGLLILLGANLVLYVLCVFFAARAAINFNRGSRLAGVVYAVLAIGPLASYVLLWVANGKAPASRAAEVASWPRVQPAADKPTARLELYGTYYNTKVIQLIETGLVGAVLHDPDVWYANRSNFANVAQHGTDCIDPVIVGIDFDQLDFISAALARRAFHDCPKFETKPQGQSFVSALPILVLKEGPGSRYRGRACQAYGDPLELRLPVDAGGGLIDFYEPPLGLPLAFPPFISFERSGVSWSCFHTVGQPDWALQQEKLFTMVAHALGRRRPEDFPRTASEQEAIAALSLIGRTADSRAKRNAFLALLGQWPSTPDIAAALRPPDFHVMQAYINDAYGLLLDPKMQERRRNYYPFLHTHAGALAALCEPAYGYAPSCGARARDVSSKLDAHAFDPG